MALPSRFILLLGFCLFGAIACAQAPAISTAAADTPAPAGADTTSKADTLSRYRLSTGDVISIAVYVKTI